ncbi:MAG: AmmeMemoRadiSam system protein B [Candidatus Omnitrophica bacterium]|nr:AmmeMemoRadiSam system protein B [Candidatus Omnitrophota bacterium]
MIREPVVSGQFYPDKASELRKAIEAFKLKDSARAVAYGLILPHAGYVYSGRVAVSAVNKVLPKKRIIILGPNHTGYGEDFGMYASGSWKIPFADLSIDCDLAQRILKSGTNITPDTLAHKFEHSIEVELPILYYFFGNFSFVPIVCGVATLSTYEKVATQIFLAVKNIKEDILFIASSDMTHYEADSTARRKDRLALEHIVNLDAEGLVKTVKKDNISMCGIAPVAILLLIMKKIGANKASVSLYETSADSGADASSVVGYAGVVIS